MAESLRPLRVIDVQEGKVVLEGYRSTLCGHCTCELPGLGGSVFEIEVQTEEPVRRGAQVQLEISSRDFLAGVAALYGLPLFFLFLGLAVGTWLAPRLGWSGSSAPVQILSAGSGLLLSLPVLRAVDRKLGCRPGYRPRLIRLAKIREDLLGPGAARIGEADACDRLQGT